MKIGKTFCGRTDGRTDGRTHLSSNLLGHRRGDDLKMGNMGKRKVKDAILYRSQDGVLISVLLDVKSTRV